MPRSFATRSTNCSSKDGAFGRLMRAVRMCCATAYPQVLLVVMHVRRRGAAEREPVSQPA